MSVGVEACTKSITVLEPFTLDCGHTPDPIYRGTKALGDRMPCVACYRVANGPTPQIEYTVCRPDKAHVRPCGPTDNDCLCACGCRAYIEATCLEFRESSQESMRKSAAAAVDGVFVSCEVPDDDDDDDEPFVQPIELAENVEDTKTQFAGWVAEHAKEKSVADAAERFLSQYNQPLAEAMSVADRYSQAVSATKYLPAPPPYAPVPAPICKDYGPLPVPEGAPRTEDGKHWFSGVAWYPSAPIEPAVGQRWSWVHTELKTQSAPLRIARIDEGPEENKVRWDGGTWTPIPRGETLESLGYVLIDHEKEEDMSTAMTVSVAQSTGALTRVFSQDQAMQLVTTTQSYKDEAEAVHAQYRNVAIVSVETQQWVAETCKNVKRRIDEIESWRTTLVRPMLDEKSLVDALFQPSLATFRDLERIFKSKLSMFDQQQRAAQEAAMKASSAQYAAGGMPTNPIPVVAQVQGVSISERWNFEIYDASLVPHELCSPDPNKIQAARSMDLADATKEPRPIPGVRFYKHSDVRMRK